MDIEAQKLAFIEKLKDKIKFNKRNGTVYLPINVVWAMNMDDNSIFSLKGQPWIFGAYTENALDIQDSMQNTISYSHLHWGNSIVALDADFNIYNYEEHLITCPKCKQIYSDKLSNYAPTVNDIDKSALCTLCKYSDNLYFDLCPKDKSKCTYEFKSELDCSNCFFNGGTLDPRMSLEENKRHLEIIKNYYETLKVSGKNKAICVNNTSWFGTIGKEYTIFTTRTLVVKDSNGGETQSIVAEVIDDLNQAVSIPIDNFEIEY